MKNSSKNGKDNFLLYVPRKKHENWIQKDNYIYLIFTHDKIIEKIVRKLFNKPNITDLKFDQFGTFIWQNIDDSKTVYEIGQCLATEFGEKCEPIYERLIMYLRYLNKMGWIKFRKEEYSRI